MKLDKYAVGRRYGKALFEAAKETDQLKEVYQELRELRKIFQDVDGLGNILSDARLEPYEKDTIFEILIGHFSGMVEDFLRVVYAYHRLSDFLFIVDEYEKRYDAFRGILYGTVKSVVPLTEDEMKRLEEKLIPLTDAKKVKLENNLDPSILGGIVVEAHGKIIDGSLKTKLKEMEKALSI